MNDNFFNLNTKTNQAILILNQQLNTIKYNKYSLIVGIKTNTHNDYTLATTQLNMFLNQLCAKQNEYFIIFLIQ